MGFMIPNSQEFVNKSRSHCSNYRKIYQ